jgi:hypothetical protein
VDYTPPPQSGKQIFYQTNGTAERNEACASTKLRVLAAMKNNRSREFRGDLFGDGDDVGQRGELVVGAEGECGFHER